MFEVVDLETPEDLKLIEKNSKIQYLAWVEATNLDIFKLFREESHKQMP